MKIVDVRARQPIAPGSPPDWRTSLGQFLVAVETDRGLVGYGVGGGGLAGIHVVRTVLRDLLIGADPQPVEAIWQQMYEATLPFGRKGIAVMALSGVDLALWDLRGKVEGRPIWRLLGGDKPEPIPVYGTFWDEIPADQRHAFRGFKLHIHPQADETDLTGRIVAAIRQARELLGPDVPLMVDAWMRWGRERTLEIAEHVADCALDWIEEPLSPDDLEGYAMLRDRCRVPIAGGEHEFTAEAFGRLIEDRLHQVLQPDVCWCGGMTQLVKIYQMAGRAGLRVCPHRGSEVWALHALSALDPDPLAESGRPWMSWVGGQPAVVEGVIRLGDAPGFGVSIEEDQLECLW